MVIDRGKNKNIKSKEDRILENVKLFSRCHNSLIENCDRYAHNAFTIECHSLRYSAFRAYSTKDFPMILRMESVHQLVSIHFVTYHRSFSRPLDVLSYPAGTPYV